MPRTFTCILEFRGGTYISQYEARYPGQALKRWATRERQRLVGSWQAGLTERVFGELEVQELMPLKGLTGAWCASATIDDEFALLNVIATEQSARGRKAG